jgi:hypothetical protein
VPATSKKQEKFMQAVAHNKAFAKKVGVPQKVGKEFTMKKYAEGGMPMVEKDGKKVPAFAADGKGKMAKGGSVKESKMMKKEGRGMAKADMQKVATKAVKGHETRMHGAKKMASGGLAAGHKQADGVASKGKTKGTQVKMAGGGYMKKSGRGC